VAEYDVDQPRIPDPWENFAFWQFAGNDRLSGIDNDVDLSVFNGERADLLKILTRQPNEPDPAR
jgi:GH25 family lysozyme M1 (1,4-beta-N-acetylmuramidase)